MKIGKVQIGKDHPLVLVSGPCVIESEEHALHCALSLKELCESCGVQLIYKASYDKGNRSSIHSYRGPGMKEGLKILRKIKERYNLIILTDIHHPEEAVPAAEVCDIIQIPAFLCRQTDLLLAAGKSKAVVNVKKGQFMAPWDMKCVVDKFLSTGNQKLILTERGTSFGYNYLVSDMRSISVLKAFGFPVCFDASHSVQQPGGMGDQSGGQREHIAILSKAALVVGADLLYIESHPNPKVAKSDKHSVMPYDLLKKLLREARPLYQFIQKDFVTC